MSAGNFPSRFDPKGRKPVPKRIDVTDKRLNILKKNADRSRIVQSVHAGHVRGGHGFH